MNKPKPFATNQAAGVANPDDPTIFIPLITAVDLNGVSASGARTYERVNGLVMSETVSNGAGSFKKTYTRDSNGDIVGETDWVKQ